MTAVTVDRLISLGLPSDIAEELARRLDARRRTTAAADVWRSIAAVLARHRSIPFAVHRLLFQAVFQDWPADRGPAPAWSPTAGDIEAANVTSLMRGLGLASCADLHAWSVEHRAEYWLRVVESLAIRFRQGYSSVLDLSGGVESPRWFPDATMNIVDSCFQGQADSAALIYRGETGADGVITVRALDMLSNRVANGLVARGFAPGDAIAIAMPMTPIAIAAYLGIVKAGCIVVSIADSFAAPEIATRLRIGNARAIVTQDFIERAGKRLQMYQKIVDAGAPPAIVTRARPLGEIALREGDVGWEEFLSDDDQFDPVACEPDNCINILFSSGTTGAPKAIPWTQATPIKCAADACFHHDVKPGDVLAWPTNLGWMMGPWLIFAALINRAAIALYDGSPANADFGRFVQDAKVTMLGVVPSLVSVWRASQSMEEFDWGAIKVFSSTGEASNPDDMLYLMSLAGYRPVIEYCGGTEIGGGYITGTVVRPCAPSTFNSLALGLDAVLLDERGAETDNGEVFLEPPSIGLSTSLINANHHDAYYEGVPVGPGGKRLRRHGDQIERLPGGYFRALGRTDDTMNLGGIKVSSAEIERVLMSSMPFREVAAIAINPEGGGPSRLVIYAVPANVESIVVTNLILQAREAVKGSLNPLFRVHDVVVVDSLPRTASNKVMRRVLRNQYAHLPCANAQGPLLPQREEKGASR